MTEHEKLMLARHLQAAALAYERLMKGATSAEVASTFCWLRDDALALANTLKRKRGGA